MGKLRSIGGAYSRTVKSMMRIIVAVILAAGSFPLTSVGAEPDHAPQYTSEGKLILPANYREWIFVSSGHGMTYGPNTRASTSPLFDNVFVNPEAYRAFLKTGSWPDKTTFVLEIRHAATEGSINKGGEFQKDLVFTEAEVKDESRFNGGWGYFEFPPEAKAAKLLPKTAECYSCHAENTAVEQTFVQFYPTLMNIAREKGTVKKTYQEASRPAAN